jgi:trans-aconitate methyltransferase
VTSGDQPPREGGRRPSDGLYERLGRPLWRPAWELLQRIKIQGGERVLEFPCLTGEITCWIAALVGKEGAVAAVESDRAKVSLARRHLHEAGHEHATVIEADPASVGRQGSFDVVFSHAPSPVAKDLAAFLDGIRTNLRPGGRFALQMPAEGFCPDLTETVDQCVSAPPFEQEGGGDGFYGSRFVFPSTKALEAALGACRFRQFDVHGKMFIERFETLADVTDHVLESAFDPVLASIPPALAPAFLEDFRRRMAVRLGKTQDLEIVFRRLFAYGRR